MALLLEALAQAEVSLSNLRSRIPTYAMMKEKLICRARDIGPSLRLLKNLYASETLDLTDGLKVIWPDRWLHARPSTTEPIIRLLAEAPTESQARTLLMEAIECLCPTA
jgi:phosphomannomutase